jgi:hypothetical protein
MYKLGEIQKRRIAATLPLPTDVLNKIEHARQKFARDMERWSAARHKDGLVIENTLVLRFNKYASQGRPRKDALRTYIKRLVPIYENATGEMINRYVPSPSTKAIQEKARTGKPLIRDKERPHPFISACLKTVGVRYPYGLVAQILHELHPDAKRGRPKKKL